MVKIVGRAFATSTFGTPREAGCHSVRREDVKRLTDLERENATLKRFLADAELQRVALKEIAKETSRPATRAAVRHMQRVFGPRITTPAQKAGQSIMSQFNAFGAKKGFRVPQRRRRKGHGNSTAPTAIADALNRVWGVDLRRLAFAVDQFAGPATAAGRSRTDPYSVTPLRAAGASRCA